MEIVVDGLIYQLQAHGGLSRLYNEVFPRLCEMEAAFQVVVLTSGQLRQTPPKHPRLRHQALLPVDSLLRPARFWQPVSLRARAWVQQTWLKGARGRVWHSTYYTLLEPWEGPKVVTVADMIHEHVPQLFSGPAQERFRAQKRHCIMAADAVICISDTSRQDLQQWYRLNPAKIYTISLAHQPLFTRLDSLSSAHDSPTNKPFLLYVGDRNHYKNFTGLLRAYSTWPRRKDVDLVVVGKQWSRPERQQLAQLGLAERVHSLSGVDDHRLCRLYNQAAAFVYPSLYEGFGIPLLEAMACGCPIVASRIPSTQEVAQECPVYFEPADPEDLCRAFDAALLEGRASERVRQGLERVQRYSWDQTARQILGVYRALSPA